MANLKMNQGIPSKPVVRTLLSLLEPYFNFRNEGPASRVLWPGGENKMMQEFTGSVTCFHSYLLSLAFK